MQKDRVINGVKSFRHMVPTGPGIRELTVNFIYELPGREKSGKINIHSKTGNKQGILPKLSQLGIDSLSIVPVSDQNTS